MATFDYQIDETSFARHHRAHAPGPAIILVVPEAGSPKNAREVKPRPYPHQEREHWRPQRAIPAKRSKVEALRRFLEDQNRRDEIVRSMMSSTPALLKSFLTSGLRF